MCVCVFVCMNMLVRMRTCVRVRVYVILAEIQKKGRFDLALSFLQCSLTFH